MIRTPALTTVFGGGDPSPHRSCWSYFHVLQSEVSGESFLDILEGLGRFSVQICGPL